MALVPASATGDETSNVCVFAMMSVGERAHDLGLAPESTALRGRLRHVAFWLDQREDVRTAADVLLEWGRPSSSGQGATAWATTTTCTSGNRPSCASS